MEVTPTGETKPVTTPSNDATATAPVTSNGSQTNAELELAKKQYDQAQLRIRQLENEKADRDKAEEEANRKKLEEENQYRELWERDHTRLETIEKERQDEARRGEINAAKAELLKGVDAKVVETADKLGIVLSDDSEAAKADYKAKLETLATTNSVKVSGNNGAASSDADDDREKVIRQMRFDDRNLSNAARQKVISSLPALDVMRKQAGYTSSEE